MADDDDHTVDSTPAALPNEVYDDRCVFCKISHGQDTTPLIIDGDEFVVFKDIHPATPHHYLVCPKTHIKSPKVLDHSHIQLVEALIRTGDEALQKQGAATTDVRRGFHWPPFTSVGHLHLHVIAESSNMGWLSRQIFRPNSWWFVTAEWLLDRLRNMQRDTQDI